MTENKGRATDRAKQGWFSNLTDNVKLVLRLMADPRVPIFLKALPVISAIYLVVPTDLWPIMPLDDAVVVGVGTYFFIEMCPPDVVAEHRAQLRGESFDAEEVIDADFKEAK
jgi:uncharacterized membrane protein YkvA (DUF1232 family)